MTKDAGEIKYIEKAVEISEKVLRDLKMGGRTEKEIAAQISHELNKRAGAAFDPIVASGKNAAVPHHTPTGKLTQQFDCVILDFGARVNHYNCDLTRTFNKRPSKKFREAYQAVVEAQRKGIKHLTPGGLVKECDEAVRSVLRDHGFEENFLHSSGHGIGLEVHEPPRISNESEEKFKRGMVVTVEPGVYIKGWGGIRIEDVVQIGRRPKVLTSTVKHSL